MIRRKRERRHSCPDSWKHKRISEREDCICKAAAAEEETTGDLLRTQQLRICEYGLRIRHRSEKRL